MNPEALWREATRTPRSILRHVGVALPKPRADRSLWPYCTIAVVAGALADNGLLDPDSLTQGGVVVGPAHWRFTGLPPTVRDPLYRWLRAEWAAYGMMLCAHAKCYRTQATGTLPGDIRALFATRDAMAGFAADPQWSRLADYVFAIDQGLDRLRDALLTALIERALTDPDPRNLAVLRDAAAAGWLPERDRAWVEGETQCQ